MTDDGRPITIDMKRVTSVYTFTAPYDGVVNGVQKKATLALEVDYLNKVYSIVPDGSGCSPREFHFIKRRNPKMWRAISTLMMEAIDFAEQALENDK